jgi:hypothetical protein
VKGKNRRRLVGRSRILERIHLDAAGIDIGSESHWVAVPEDRAERQVREFRSFTQDLIALADWLEACGIDTVAMESTGVYWIPLYESSRSSSTACCAIGCLTASSLSRTTISNSAPASFAASADAPLPSASNS